MRNIKDLAPCLLVKCIQRIRQYKLHRNTGYSFLEDSVDSIFLGGAFEIGMSDSLTLIGEIWSEFPAASSDDNEVAEILGGAAYALSDNLMMDFGIGTGLYKEDVDLRYTAGLTYSF